jgi:hypothetical protein
MFDHANATCVKTIDTYKVLLLQMRAGNLELGDPFRDLRETIKIVFVRAVKENIFIHQVGGGVEQQ